MHEVTLSILAVKTKSFPTRWHHRSSVLSVAQFYIKFLPISQYHHSWNTILCLCAWEHLASLGAKPWWPICNQELVKDNWLKKNQINTNERQDMYCYINTVFIGAGILIWPRLNRILFYCSLKSSDNICSVLPALVLHWPCDPCTENVDNALKVQVLYWLFMPCVCSLSPTVVRCVPNW